MRNLFTIDTHDYDPNGTVFSRPFVRAIIIADQKVLMVHSLKYDYYKFPGGGIDAGEGMEEALCREVAEEAGRAIVHGSVREYGLVRRINRGDKSDIFLQDNFYYLCDAGEAVGQCLDDYEAEERFTPEFVTPQHAIETNRFHDHGTSEHIMLEREALVLERLMEEGYFA